MKLEFSGQIFKKSSNIKFHKNLSSGSQVVSCGQTDMTKLIVAFRNFADAPKSLLNTPTLPKIKQICKRTVMRCGNFAFRFPINTSEFSYTVILYIFLNQAFAEERCLPYHTTRWNLNRQNVVWQAWPLILLWAVRWLMLANCIVGFCSLPAIATMLKIN